MEQRGESRAGARRRGEGTRAHLAAGARTAGPRGPVTRRGRPAACTQGEKGSRSPPAECPARPPRRLGGRHGSWTEPAGRGACSPGTEGLCRRLCSFDFPPQGLRDGAAGTGPDRGGRAGHRGRSARGRGRGRGGGGSRGRRGKLTGAGERLHGNIPELLFGITTPSPWNFRTGP